MDLSLQSLDATFDLVHLVNRIKSNPSQLMLLFIDVTGSTRNFTYKHCRPPANTTATARHQSRKVNKEAIYSLMSLISRYLLYEVFARKQEPEYLLRNPLNIGCDSDDNIEVAGLNRKVEVSSSLSKRSHINNDTLTLTA